MTNFQKLENRRILVILLSSLSFIVLSAFSGNLVQPIYGANFGAAGDWGCSSNTEATVSNMDAKNPQFVFGLGDYSYASTGSCWFSRIDPEIDNQMKIAIGNHEDDSSEGFQGYMDRFGLSQTYYSYDQENVHVLVIDTDRNSFSSSSSQYNFIKNDLQQASQDPDIDWIIAYLHKPMYTSSNTCDSSGCTNGGSTATSLRNTYHPLFDQYGVDLVLAGHVHNYQRTFTLKYDQGSPSSPTITSNNANTYTEGNGAVFAIVGTGGVGFFGLSAKASFVSSQQDDFFGQLDIRTSNGGNTLEGKFYRNGNNAVLDSFSITKAANSLPVANPQTVSVNKDTAKPITLTATDSNNDPLTYSIVAQPSHGTLSPNTPGGPARTYTPAAGYVGPDSFTFKANDGIGDSNTATVTINVAEPPQGSYNYAPSFVATGSTFNDTPSSSALQLSQFSVAAWFKTSTNFGSNAFIVNKGGIGSDSAGNNMNYGIWMTSAEKIQAGFEAVSGGADHFVTSPNTYNDNQWHYAVVTNDGSTVRLYIDGVEVATKSTAGASPESSGTKPVRVGANSRVTPPTHFFTGEIDEVRVWNNDLTAQQVADAFAGTSFNTGQQVLHLPFGASAAPPVANNQNVIVTKNTPTAITLTATDPNNDPLTYTVVTQPTNGTLTGTAPNLNYNPTTDYVGPDSFTFKANDGTADSNIATVSITVQEPGQGGYNYAPSFAATGSNYDETPSAANLQLSQFTIAAWFNTNFDYTTEGFVITKGGIGSDSAGNNMNYGMWMTSSEQIKGGFETATGADHFVTSTNTYNNAQWRYGTVTYDGSTVRLYVDGIQLGTKSTAGASPESSGTKPVRVGANSLSINKFFNGGIDEVRIWNRALSAQEVTDAFAGTFNTAGQVLYLPFSSSATSSGYQYDPSLSLSGPN